MNWLPLWRSHGGQRAERIKIEKMCEFGKNWGEMESRAGLLRALGDKLYEKRKAAALEIEELIRELIKAKNTR